MQFTKKFLSLVISVALVTGTETVAFAQSSINFSQKPADGWDNARLSNAVITNAQLAGQNYAKKKKLGKVTVADVQTAAFAMKTLFDHYQEIGLNDAIEKLILNNQDAFLNYVPSNSDLQTVQDQLRASGISISNDSLRSKFSEGREQFLAMVQEKGFYNTELWYVQQFTDQETQNALQDTVSLEGVRVNRSMPMGRVVRVSVTPICKACVVGFVPALFLPPVTGPVFMACVVCACGG